MAVGPMQIRLNEKITSPSVWSVFVPIVLFVLHSLLFRHWIIDDAGITFAYARNLAAGFGLVSQPGVIPVEGYSNFLWLIGMVPFYWLRLFDPQLTPKILGVVLTAITFALMGRSLRRIISPLAVFVALSLIATNTSFVAWVNSGLENSLYVLLIAYLFNLIVDSLLQEERVSVRSGKIAFVASLIALTRPDGVIFFLAYPIAAMLVADRQRVSKLVLKDLVGYAATFFALYGSYILFRILYFHDFWPNTYYAKIGTSSFLLMNAVRIAFWTIVYSASVILVRYLDGRVRLGSRIAAALIGVDSVFAYGLLPAHLKGLFSSVAGPLAGIFFGLLAGSSVFLLGAAQRDRTWSLSLLFLYLSLVTYTLLPPDWMSEYRFATASFVFLYIFAVVTFRSVAGPWMTRVVNAKMISYALIAGLLLGNALFFASRSLSFASHPPSPLSDVMTRAAQFNDYAGRHHIRNGSILTPDVGGELLSSHLRVYDLGMLCDRTIANTLGKRQNLFYDYVFDEIRPTFIAVTNPWRQLANLERDPRFVRDYTPLEHEISGLDHGVYVRADAGGR